MDSSAPWGPQNDKKKMVTGAFILETFENFVRRLCEAVGCYNHPIQGGYSIKKHNTNQHRQMGVFGWVFELKRTNRFRIESYKDLSDRAGVTNLADEIKKNRHYQKGVDGIFFFVGRGSYDEDYKKAITALKAILNMKN